MSEATDTSAAPAGAAGPGPSKLPLLVALINTLAIMGALGTFVYTRILFKRPVITEEAERARLADEALKKANASAVSGTVTFPPVTINIKPTFIGPETGAKALASAKLHYATMAFTLELRDERQKDLIETLQPVIFDRVLSLMGRKNYADLTSVQGRYVVRTQMQDIVNQLVAAETKDKTAAVTNVYFSTFMIQ